MKTTFKGIVYTLAWYVMTMGISTILSGFDCNGKLTKLIVAAFTVAAFTFASKMNNFVITTTEKKLIDEETQKEEP